MEWRIMPKFRAWYRYSLAHVCLSKSVRDCQLLASLKGGGSFIRHAHLFVVVPQSLKH